MTEIQNSSLDDTDDTVNVKPIHNTYISNPLFYGIDIILSNFICFKDIESLKTCASSASLHYQRASVRFYTVSQILRAFRLVAIYDLYEDRRINDDT